MFVEVVADGRYLFVVAHEDSDVAWLHTCIDEVADGVLYAFHHDVVDVGRCDVFDSYESCMFFFLCYLCHVPVCRYEVRAHAGEFPNSIFEESIVELYYVARRAVIVFGWYVADVVLQFGVMLNVVQDAPVRIAEAVNALFDIADDEA